MKTGCTGWLPVVGAIEVWECVQQLSAHFPIHENRHHHEAPVWTPLCIRLEIVISSQLGLKQLIIGGSPFVAAFIILIAAAAGSHAACICAHYVCYCFCELDCGGQLDV